MEMLKTVYNRILKMNGFLKLNAREKTLGDGEKLEDFETHFV
jgi:hypothetical protein